MAVSPQYGVIGLDLGTTGAKGILVDGSGRTVVEISASYDVSHPRPLWAEQHPDVWLQGGTQVLRAIAQGAEEAGLRPAALCVSGLYGGSGVPCDGQMRPLHPALIWMDRRAVDQAEAVKRTIGLDRLVEITGNGADPYYGFTKVLWLKENQPDMWAKVRHLVTPNGYFIYHLTGRLSMDYSSAGNLGGFFDLRRRQWSDELLDALDVPRQLFPDTLLRSDDIVGELTPEAASRTGLPSGLPVCAGGIDAAVATLAAGVLAEGEHAAMVGTSMCWGTVHERGVLSPALVSMPYVIESETLTYSFGGAAMAGGAAKWFRDQFGQLETMYGQQIGRSPYQLLDEQAARVAPGSDGLITLPYFMGERSPLWDPHIRASIVGLTPYHTRAHVYRSILEAVAFTLRQNMELVQAVDVALAPELRLVGGVAASNLWTQIIADVTGFPVVRPTAESDAPLGDALMAAKAVGLVSSYDDAVKTWVRFKEPVQPVADHAAVYDEAYARFRELYERLKGF